MKSPLVLTLAFAALFAVTLADCNKDGHSFKVGETYTPIGKCIKYTCGSNTLFEGVGCSLPVAQRNYKFTPVDLTKPYPKCCPSLQIITETIAV